MKKLILHVGFHKTATSSIQKTLADNQKKLARLGYEYPIFERHNQKIINHSIPFFSLYSPKPENYHINIKNGDSENINEANNDYRQQIEKALKSNNNIIISGEDISVLPLPALIALRQQIENQGFSLQVYCSVRRPYSFTCSELQESIKTGTMTMDKIRVSKKSDVIKKLRQAFDDTIHFFSFEQDCQTKLGAVGQFIHRIGLNPKDFRLVSNNEGFGNLTTRFLAALNSTHPNIINGKINPEGRGYYQKSLDQDKFLLTQSEMQSICQELNTENQKLKHLLDDSFCDEFYPTLPKPKVTRQQADKLLADYTNEYTYPASMRFILKHADFNVIPFVLQQADNPPVFRNLAQEFKTTDLAAAMALIAAARRGRPNGPKIVKLYNLISTSLMKKLKIGVAVIGDNDLDDLKQTLQAIINHTSGSYELCVTTPNNNSIIRDWCQQQRITHINGKKSHRTNSINLALYYLHHIKSCDVMLVLGSQCKPNQMDWYQEWVIASYLWGHVGYSVGNNELSSEKEVGFRPYTQLHHSPLCFGCNAISLSEVGYLSPNNHNSNASYLLWVTRFTQLGYGVYKDNNYHGCALSHGIRLQKAVTGDTTKQIRSPITELNSKSIVKPLLPWRTPFHKQRFLRLLPQNK